MSASYDIPIELDPNPQDTLRDRPRRLHIARPQPRGVLLRCVSSPHREIVNRALRLDGSAYTLGRGPQALPCVQDPKLSRSHCRIAPSANGEGYEVHDLGAANGTIVDGVDAREGPRPLTRTLTVGETLFVVDAPVDHDSLPFHRNVPDEEVRGILGVSTAASAIRRSLHTVAPTRGAVLLLGATGTGKDVAALALHELSGRPGPFVPVNCAAIPRELAEVELFGSVRSAFTGADVARCGLFEQAHGGTLFLDEVGDLPSPIQAKLLRVLEDQVVRPVGGSLQDLRHVDVRIVAATQSDLGESGFRPDLLARLKDWELRLPRLANRRADVLHLWRAFCGGNPLPMTVEFQEALVTYDWPTNIRELRRLARRVVELALPGEPLDIELLPRSLREHVSHRVPAPAPAPPGAPPAPVDERRTPGRDVILQALVATRGNVKLTADENGWHRTQLYRWIKRLGIDLRSIRGHGQLSADLG